MNNLSGQRSANGNDMVEPSSQYKIIGRNTKIKSQESPLTEEVIAKCMRALEAKDGDNENKEDKGVSNQQSIQAGSSTINKEDGSPLSSTQCNNGDTVKNSQASSFVQEIIIKSVRTDGRQSPEISDKHP